jgi:hypothetical protein
MRIDDDLTRPLMVAGAPESFLQLSQWQYRRTSGASETSNLTPPQRQLPRRAVMQPSLYVVALFVAAAAYELSVALEWIELPTEPGAAPPGQAIATVAALVATGATIVVARWARAPVFALIPVAAAAWMVAHYSAFDPYYLPTHRRYSDAGSVAPLWVYGVAAGGLAVAFLSLRTRMLAPVYVVVCLLTVIGMGIGH